MFRAMFLVDLIKQIHELIPGEVAAQVAKNFGSWELKIQIHKDYLLPLYFENLNENKTYLQDYFEKNKEQRDQFVELPDNMIWKDEYEMDMRDDE